MIEVGKRMIPWLGGKKRTPERSQRESPLLARFVVCRDFSKGAFAGGNRTRMATHEGMKYLAMSIIARMQSAQKNGQ